MEFRDKIYKIVKNIPKGRVATYKSIAIAIGQPQTSRAVANALAQNFNPKIPCHRVIRSDGFLGGYNRGGLTHKAKLLRSEGVLVKNNRVESKSILLSQLSY